MVNPLLTILFDIFLIGSAVAVSASMVAEYLMSREPHVGTTRPALAARAQRRAPVRTVSRPATVRRRAA